MSKRIHIKVSGSWKEVKSVWRKVSGSWVKDVMPYYKVSGAWKECMSYSYLYEGVMTVGSGMLASIKGWGESPFGKWGSMNPEIDEEVATTIFQGLHSPFGEDPYVTYETDYSGCTIISIDGVEVENGTHYPGDSDLLPEVGETCNIILK